MDNKQPHPEKGAHATSGLGTQGTSAPPTMSPNPTGDTDSGASPPPYAPSYAGATSGSGPLHTGGTATSDQYPTAVQHLQSPVMGQAQYQPQPQQQYQHQNLSYSGPSGPQHQSLSYSGPSGRPTASDPSHKSEYPPDIKQDPFSPAQPGYSQPSYTQGYSQPGYNTGSHYEDALSSAPGPSSGPGNSPPYPPASKPSFSAFSPDTVGSTHGSPTPAYAPQSYAPQTYTAPSLIRPIAIPQVNLNPTSPLLPAYPPQLLARGIPRDRWLAFLASLSAILGASDAENNKAHRADIGREMGKVPTNFGTSVADHATHIGRDLKKNARKGNLLGVTGTLIGGAVAWPVATSLKAVGAILTLPGSTMSAVAKKPLKRAERAKIAAADAGKGWLHERGYHASLMSTEELASVTSVEVRRFVDAGRGGPADACEKMSLMVERLELAEVDVQKGLGELEVGKDSLWLVLVPYVPDEA